MGRPGGVWWGCTVLGRWNWNSTLQLERARHIPPGFDATFASKMPALQSCISAIQGCACSPFCPAIFCCAVGAQRLPEEPAAVCREHQRKLAQTQAQVGGHFLFGVAAGH